ncbi:TonB-dependent receptor [Pseudomonas sp. ABC1]|uniref:TonB-dependent receptor n=1 Tax=Pseudomonas sp. ABC1 TaxID=2748080 RepID=UPI00211A7C5E|nr:TonB-dependent receptor [Pseudomonas sp. ABC1]
MLACLVAVEGWGQEATLSLEPVNVSARHRAEASEDVPVSMTVLDGEQLEQAGLYGLREIQQKAPGLVVSGHGPRHAGYGLRGFGATAFNDGLDSSVGIFVDGVYLGRQGMAFSDLLDVERIEVLRGPQGTLFGKNSSAGALNITTRQPTFHDEVEAEASFGSYGERRYRATLSGALFDDVLAGRFSFVDRTRDGTVDNRNNGSSINTIDSQAMRGQLLWTPNEYLSARLIAEVGRDDSVSAVLASHYSEQSDARAVAMGYQMPTAAPFERNAWDNQPLKARSDQNALSLQLDWQIADYLGLTSITAYRDWALRDARDADGMDLSIAYLDTALDQRQFSQELRLSGALGSNLDYVAGLYYLQQTLEREHVVEFGEDAGAWFVADQLDELRNQLGLNLTHPRQIPSFLLGGTRQTLSGEQKSDSRAVFSHVTWRPRERLELTAGLRYTYERKRGWVAREASGEVPLSSLPPTLQAGGELLRQLALGDYYYRRDSVGEGDISSLLGASYRFNDQVLGYANWSRGHKAGGINFDVVGPQTRATFDAEQATSVEVGLKTRFWQQRASLDLALYQTDVDDYQALTLSQPEHVWQPPLRNNLLNVGKARLRGVELDSQWRLHSRLDMRLGVAWSDARYRSFDNAPCGPGTAPSLCDYSGKRLYNAPEWNATAGLDYRHPLGLGLEGFAGLDQSLRSGYYGTLEGGKGSWQPGYGLTNLRMGLRASDHGWEVEFWVRNLFDRDYVTAVYATLGLGDYAVTPGDPRTLGMTMRVRL